MTGKVTVSGRKIGNGLRNVWAFLLRRAGDVPPYLGNFGVMHLIAKILSFSVDIRVATGKAAPVMKIKSLTKPIPCSLILVGIALALAPISMLQGAVVVNYAVAATQTGYTVSSTDLINLGQATFSSQTTSEFTAGGGDPSYLNDGNLGTASVIDPGTTYSSTAFSTTFNLDLTTNTLGYNITNINVYAGWTLYQYYNQAFDASYSTVSAPTTWISLGAFTNLLDTGGAGTSFTSLTNDVGGAFATNVAAIKFNFYNLYAGHTAVYREVDVLGAAAVPEPATWALLAFSLTSVMVLRRRRS